MFPVVLVLGSLALGHCVGPNIQSSISGYYHTNMRDVFVGVLCIVAFFMFSYDGYTKWDALAGKMACLFALTVAFFPTSADPPYNACTILPLPAAPWVSNVHYLAAALLFFTLTLFSLVLFTKSRGGMTPQKRKRNVIYRVCGVVMLLCIAFLAVYFAFFKHVVVAWKPGVLGRNTGAVGFRCFVAHERRVYLQGQSPGVSHRYWGEMGALLGDKNGLVNSRGRRTSGPASGLQARTHPPWMDLACR